MKKLQQLFAAVVLTILLSIAVLAGDGIIAPGIASPTPTPTSVTTASTTTETTETDGIIVAWLTATDSDTGVALNLLNTLLTLF